MNVRSGMRPLKLQIRRVQGGNVGGFALSEANFVTSPRWKGNDDGDG